MSDEVLGGLAGGAMGALLAALIIAFGRAKAALDEIGVHDAESNERNRQLVAWVDDRTRALVQQMNVIANENAARGLFNSGLNGVQLAEAKAKALHEYRDEEWRARLDLMRLHAREGGWHAFWRFWKRSHAPRIEVDTLDKVAPFLERWREPVTRHQGEPAVPFDRTRRRTVDAHAELPNLTLT